MGLALIFVFVSLLVGGITYYHACMAPPSGKPFKDAVTAFIIAVVILGSLLTAIIVGDSYDSYLENRSFYDATVEQYRGAVRMYKDYAVIDINKTRAAFTDFKYQGYQKEIAGMILALQRNIISYNRSFILKKIKNDSWFFNWYIIANDPDMKIIRMLERRQETEGQPN